MLIFVESVQILESTELLASMCYFKIMFVLDTKKDVGNEEVERILIRFVLFDCKLFLIFIVGATCLQTSI